MESQDHKDQQRKFLMEQLALIQQERGIVQQLNALNDHGDGAAVATPHAFDSGNGPASGHFPPITQLSSQEIHGLPIPASSFKAAASDVDEKPIVDLTGSPPRDDAGLRPNEPARSQSPPAQLPTVHTPAVQTATRPPNKKRKRAPKQDASKQGVTKRVKAALQEKAPKPESPGGQISKPNKYAFDPAVPDVEYANIVWDGEEYVELGCYKCPANSCMKSKKKQLFRGAYGLCRHLRVAHPGEETKNLSLLQVVQLCKKRTLTGGEVNAVKNGQHDKFAIEKVANPYKRKLEIPRRRLPGDVESSL